jgi:hypothetical protein
MEGMTPMRRLNILLFCAAILALAGLVACGSSGGGVTNSAAPATTTVTISDPPTCSSSTAPSGPFTSVFVTITDVQINSSSTAGDNDSSWIDLTPDLKNAPVTIDLLSAASSQCFLATLGATTALPAGSYQQIRVILASTGSNSSCGAAGPNCVVLASDPNSPRPLLLSSQDKTGIKIPSGQIAGGQFMVTAGQNKTLNIDFNACASIVTQGNGQFRLKPVLHAGEVNTTSSAVDGKLVDKDTGSPIPGAKAIVVLEQKDAAGIDRMIMQTTPNSSGAFSFCPVPAGTYDIVVVAVSGAGVSYAPAIVTGVGPGSSLGNIPLTAVTGASTAPGSITGQVTSADSTPAGIAEDVTLSALAAVNSSTFTIPLAEQSSATVNVTTAADASCPPNTDCVSYTLSLPGVTPQAVAFTSGTPISFSSGGTVPGSYTVEAAANCTPAMVTSAALPVSPGVSTPNPTPLAMTSCQ